MEILLAAVVLFVASVLVNVPPPVNTTAASAGPVASAPTGLVVEGHDYATSVKLDLTITPGIAGANTSGGRRPGENPALNH